jgi:hypothetical protein
MNLEGQVARARTYEGDEMGFVAALEGEQAVALVGNSHGHTDYADTEPVLSWAIAGRGYLRHRPLTLAVPASFDRLALALGDTLP